MKLARGIAIPVLGFLAVSALAGAIPMLVDPYAPAGKLPLSLLRNSPFHSFLIPGILLLLANGLLPGWILWAVIARKPHYGQWVTFQGCVLLVWLATESGMLQLIFWPHYLFGSLALVLVLAGVLLWREPEQSPSAQERERKQKIRQSRPPRR